MNQPDPSIVLDLIDAFRRSKTMFAAVSLGVFDRLGQSPASAAGLAAEMQADPAALERLLDGCAGLGLIEKANEVYSNNAIADVYLRSGSPRTLAGYVKYSDRALYPMWGNLEAALREGTHRWVQTFGPGTGLFSHFFRTEEAMREFLLGMHGFGMLTSPAVVEAFDLSRFHCLVDLGGATGHLAMAARSRYPNMQASVFDLPRVVGYARDFARNIELISGDFFDDPLPPADLYAVGRILHDWGEDKIRRLLVKVHQALPPGGALIVAEKLLDDDKTGPAPALMQSLNMLICTEGRERTLPEYRELLVAAGFDHVEGRRTGTPLDVVLAVKGEPSM